MTTLQNLQKIYDAMEAPEYWFEDCHLCDGNGCEECEEGILMETYKVTIDFKKNASFETIIQSENQEEAEKNALKLARSCGFLEQVKKCKSIIFHEEKYNF